MKTSGSMTPTLSAVVAVALFAIALAGCGGSSSGADQATGDGGGGEAGPTPTKSEFVKQASAICANLEKEIQDDVTTYLKSKGIKELGAGESPTEAKALQIELVERFGLPTLRKQREEIGALGLPSEGATQVKAYLAALDEGIEGGEQEPALIFDSSQDDIAKSDKIAKELGLKACSNR